MLRLTICLGFLAGATICFGQVKEGVSQSDRDQARSAFSKGVDLLEASQPRLLVLEQWKAGLRKDTQSDLARQVADYIPLLERQVEEEKSLARETVAHPEQLPLPSRIDYFIKRFVDVHGEQMGEPGFCHTVAFGNWFGNDKPIISPPTQYSDSILQIGRPAIPALIQHLNDTRLTRSIGYRRGQWRILRVQDVAVECIECITHCQFFFPRASVDYLSLGPPERTQKILQEINA